MLNSQILPRNGLLVVQSEINAVIVSMRRISRWSSSSSNNDEYSQLVLMLNEFKDQLMSVDDLNRLGRNDFLNPFLNVIRSEDTNSPATSTALGALNKFLNYGLVDFSSVTIAESIADAVIHAKFIGTDQASDGVVFLGIVHVLRNLMYSKGGRNLSNNCVCEIILICIRICFESRYNETLKRSTETYLKDIIHLLFSRLSEFHEDVRNHQENKCANLSLSDVEKQISNNEISESSKIPSMEYVNPKGVRFMSLCKQDSNSFFPCDLFTIRELFRFLITLCNIKDKEKTEYMIHIGLNLLKVTFEVSADSFDKFPSILALVRNDLSKNLISLLNHERLSIFSLSLQVSYLMFESLRKHLKLQFECFLQKLLSIFRSQSTKMSNEQREVTLDMILQIWRTPGLITELYFNYDCDLHTVNLFEDIFNLFLTNLSNPITNNIFQMSLNGIITLIDSIEGHCTFKNDSLKSNCDINLPVISYSCRHQIDKFVPDRSQISYVKNIKKILPEGIALFNESAKKGIKFFQENAYLKSDSDPIEIANFLREIPGLDKKVIGDYISSRNNLQILNAYVKTFDFSNLRLDDSLRIYMETFRLPGEAALIHIILEQFAEHWHNCNGEPFANKDAAFTLAYSIIMLNVDQHNPNVRKQHTPMSINDFKKMLSDVNGGQNFDENMLETIFNSIKNEEIIMPAERDGVVKENYLWRILLKKNELKEGHYLYVQNGLFDYELLLLIWPKLLDNYLIAVYDKTADLSTCTNILKLFEKIATILSFFELSDDLNTLIIALCNLFRFPTLNSLSKNQFQTMIYFGNNKKLQTNLKTIFRLIQSHANVMGNSWRNILDILKVLFEIKLLPDSLVETENFIEPSGKVSLMRDNDGNQNQQDTKFEMGLLGSFYMYMLSDNVPKTPSQEEQKSIDLAKQSIEDCHLEQILNDTKFLQFESLSHLVDLLIELSSSNNLEINDDNQVHNNCEVSAFFLELLIKILIQNRDRILPIWKSIHDHFCSIIVFNSKLNQFLFEQSIIGLLKLAINLMRNEEMSTTVLQSLQILFLVKPSLLLKNSKQISFGLYELLKTSAQNIHSNSDWNLVFMMLEFFGAGMRIPQKDADCFDEEFESGLQSEEDVQAVDKGYISDSELSRSPLSTSRPQSPITKSNASGWILIEHEKGNNISEQKVNKELPMLKTKKIIHHDPYSMSKCCDCLTFLVRDVAHITPFNYQSCLECIRCFVEAVSFISYRRHKATLKRNKSSFTNSGMEYYQQVSVQLLDLIFTLYTRTAQIFQWWADENSEFTQKISYWNQGWCPLLQGIVKLCCHFNNQIRTSAIGYLQRALLFQDVQLMTAFEWHECFHQVLYPLLNNLLEMSDNNQEIRFLEESRIRTITFVSKMYLHNLNSLSKLDNFHQLWSNLIDFMQKFMYVDNSELLFEAIPECLKNMLLVMNSANLFENKHDNSLWAITWKKLDDFLPNLRNDLFNVDKNDKKLCTENQPNDNLELLATSNIENINMVQQNEEKNTGKTNVILQPPLSEFNAMPSPLFSFFGQVHTNQNNSNTVQVHKLEIPLNSEQTNIHKL